MASDQGYRSYRVLLVDDEDQSREYFQEVFGEYFDVLTAPSAEAAWELLQEEGQRTAVLITDQRMPGQSGVDLLERVRTSFPHIVRILTTAYSDLTSAVDAMNKGGAYRYIKKPWELELVHDALTSALQFFLVRKDRDRLLREKLHVLQRLIVMDRVRGLAALSTAISCRLRYPMSALRAYMRQASLEMWRGINMDGASQMDLVTLARSEGENLVGAVQEVLWATLPWGLEGWDVRLDRYQDDVDVAQTVRNVTERYRMDSGQERIVLQVDETTSLPSIKANPDLLCRVYELLFERIWGISGKEATIVVRIVAEASEKRPPRVCLHIHAEGTPWMPEQAAILFSAAIPRSDWTKGMELDILPAFFLVHHHAGSLDILPDSPHGPGFDIWLPIDLDAHKDEPLDEAWFDDVFTSLEEWDQPEPVSGYA